MGLTNTLEEEVGFGAASWARILEQGLAFDELVEMKTSIERGAQGGSGGDQLLPTERAAGRAAVPPSSELSDGEGVAAQGGWYPCGSWDVQQQLKPHHGSIIVGTLAVRSGRGILSRTAWPCALRDSSSGSNSSSCNKSRRKQMCG